MTRYCIQCGASLDIGARFCGDCGAAVAVVGEVAHVEGVEALTDDSVPEALIDETPTVAPQETYRAIEEAVVMDDRKRPNWLLIGGGAMILLLLVGYYFLFLRDDMSQNLEDRVSASPKQAEEVVSKEYFAVADANIRDRPTTSETSIIGKLPRGTSVAGTAILGEDGSSDWIELPDGKGFVAMVNLSETQPPELVKMLGEKSWTTDQPIEIRAQPDTASALLDRVGPGTTLSLFGITADDFIEIKLKKGGVGYIADGARIVELANGKPIAIAFNPDSCSFGPEIDRMFASMGERLRANYRAVENREYPDEAAREKALAAIEGKSTFQKLQRNYAGLTVTAIAQHYESQSIYFAEPAAQVIEAFRGKGHSIGRDGQFAGTELFAGIGSTQAQGARFGKADLTCGV
jgi:hypothetical protein